MILQEKRILHPRTSRVVPHLYVQQVAQILLERTNQEFVCQHNSEYYFISIQQAST